MVEKRMLFGNFKPRLLTVMREKGLRMAYRYAQSRQVKREWAVGANDYACLKAGREFEAVSQGNTFVFRANSEQAAAGAIESINRMIRATYKLD